MFQAVPARSEESENRNKPEARGTEGPAKQSTIGQYRYASDALRSMDCVPRSNAVPHWRCKTNCTQVPTRAT